jgi:hypothetical protein
VKNEEKQNYCGKLRVDTSSPHIYAWKNIHMLAQVSVFGSERIWIKLIDCRPQYHTADV